MLLVDNSNSRTKFRLLNHAGISDECRIISTAQISLARLSTLLDGWSYHRVAVASVVPQTAALFRRFFDCPVDFLQLSHAATLVDFSDYLGRDTLGADRIANILAVVQKQIFPVVAIDAGTAVTFDVVTCGDDGLPRFIGGTIAPGFAAYRDYLHHQTALLPPLPHPLPVLPSPLAQSTLEAVTSGVSLSFCGAIREILSAIAANLSSPPLVVATGGDAHFLAAALPQIHQVEPLMTFRGLAFMCKSKTLL